MIIIIFKNGLVSEKALISENPDGEILNLEDPNNSKWPYEGPIKTFKSDLDLLKTIPVEKNEKNGKKKFKIFGPNDYCFVKFTFLKNLPFCEIPCCVKFKKIHFFGLGQKLIVTNLRFFLGGGPYFFNFPNIEVKTMLHTEN